MEFRVISISDEDKESILNIYEWFTGVTNEYTLNPTDIEVGAEDAMVIIWAQDNFDKAIELGRKFYQAGVLTIGVFPEYIDEKGCFDAQTINDGKAILSIVRALTCPAIYSGPISFDFNDIHTTLKDAGRFYARFIYGVDFDSLISKVTDKFQQIDMSKVESACVNLYGELPMEFKSWGIDNTKINDLLKIMSKTSSALCGIHQLPDTFTCIPDEMIRETSFGISFILAGKNIKI